MKLKFGDIILFVIIISIAMLFAVSFGDKGNVVVIEQNGQVLEKISLYENNELTIGNVIIVIQDGSVRIKDSDCADKTCINTGNIDNSGEIICCLPNRLLVRIETDSKEVDVITG